MGLVLIGVAENELRVKSNNKKQVQNVVADKEEVLIIILFLYYDFLAFVK
jgi:hypothetical protein